MLDSFRNNMRGIATVIVVFIGGIFAFTGTGSLFVSGVGADTALVVNGEKVRWLFSRLPDSKGIEFFRLMRVSIPLY